MDKSFIDIINGSSYVLVVTHTNPDADTISSALALSNYMYENRIKHKVYNSTPNPPRVLDFLPRFDKITTQIPKYYDLVIYVDCADQHRAKIELKDDVTIINIDHHQTNTNFGKINIVDDTKGSSCEVLYESFIKYKVDISNNIATCLYTGIYDDTIGFTTPRVDQKTFENVTNLIKAGAQPSYIANRLLQRDSLAKYRIIPKILDTLKLYQEGKIATIYLDNSWLIQTGATIQECDDVVNMVLSIGVVKIVAYFRVIDDVVRVSLRSKDNIDVSKIAEKFNGGGHKYAAGLSIEGVDIEASINKVIKNIKW